jgi:O-antigen/teichoic acid export membrane protein
VINKLERLTDNPVRWATVLSVLTGIFGQGTTLLSGVLAARILGVEDRGYFALLAVFPTLCSSLLGLGFPLAVTYQIAANPNHLSKIVKLAINAFGIQVLVIVVMHGAVVWFFLAHYADIQRTTAYLTILVGPAMLGLQYGVAFLQGMGKYNSLSILRLLLPTTYALMVLGLFVLGVGDLHRVTFVWVIASVFSGTVAMVLVRRLKYSRAETQTIGHSPSQNEMLKFGLKGLLGSTSPLDTFRIDQLVAGLILSPIALGLYVVGGAFGTLTRLIAQSASMVAYPTIVNRRNGEAGWRTLWRFFGAVTFVNGLLTICLMVSMPWLIPWFFGEDFIGAVPLGQILLLGSAFVASRRILVEGLRGLGQPHVSTFAEISMYPWLLTGGVFLLWHYGVKGLASGVAIGFFISLAVALWFAWNQRSGDITIRQRSQIENSLP